MLDVNQYSNEELVKMYRDSVDYAADVLWEQNLGLTNKFISRQQAFNYFYYDDLLHMAHVAFISSLKYYDESKGFKFTALYGKAFNMEISDEINKSHRPKHKVKTTSLDLQLGIAEESNLYNLLRYEMDYSNVEIDMQEVSEAIKYSLSLIKPIYHEYILEYLLMDDRPSARILAERITKETGEHKTQQIISKTIENFRKYAKDYIFYNDNKRSRIAEKKCALV